MKTLRMMAAFAACVVVCAGAARAQARAALVQDVDQPGRNTFVLRSDVSAAEADYTVPAGKRYVIDQYTVDCGVPTTTSMIDVVLIATTSGGLGYFHAPQPHPVTGIQFGFQRWAVTAPGPIYADAGTDIRLLGVAASASASDLSECVYMVSGHVINNP